MSLPEIIHHGAVDGVTGSCHELRLGKDYGILIDCGLFQGAETSRGGSNSERLEIDFDIAHIKALVVTHVHIDHAGRIPYLLAAGFKGPIYCSEPSALLLPLVLEDAVKIGISREPELIKKFLGRLKKQIVPIPYGEWYSLLEEDSRHLNVRLQRAGHILGSAYVELDSWTEDMKASKSKGYRYVFSGDLGAPHAPLLPPPRPPSRCDTLVIESTYGDKNHPDRRNRKDKLQAVIEHALENAGTLLIPAFSIGRTQEILYELEALINRGKQRQIQGKSNLAWNDLEVIVDSPLASRFTASYRQLKPFWDAEARKTLHQGRDPLDFDQLTTVGSHREHMKKIDYLKNSGHACVVVAASGMCAGGRIMNYLKALIEDERSDILFVGYQARGTPGNAIQTYGPTGGYVKLDGQKYDIRAAVHRISGYSAHAGRSDLLNFASRIRNGPGEVRLIHGDDDAKKALAVDMKKLIPDAKVWIP